VTDELLQPIMQNCLSKDNKMYTKLFLCAGVLFWGLIIAGCVDKNLLPNSSFEIGSWGWAPHPKIYGYCDVVESEQTGSPHGKFYFVMKDHKFVRKDYKALSHFESQFIELKPGQYTISFWTRRKGNDSPKIGVSLKNWQQIDDSEEPDIIVEPSSDWRRYQFHKYVEDDSPKRYQLYIERLEGKSGVHFDAFCVKKGRENSTQNDFLPIPLEIACYTTDKAEYGTFTVGQKLAFQIKIYCEYVDAHLKLQYQIYDIYDSLRFDESTEFLADGKKNHVFMKTLEEAWNETGVFRMVVTVKDEGTNRKSTGEALFVVIPDLTKSTVDFVGDHVRPEPNYLNLYRKLGTHWIRFLSQMQGTYWKNVEPANNDFHLSKKSVGIYQNAGMSMLGLFYKTPQWATRSPTENYVASPPADWSEFTEYVHRIVAAHQERIRFWEVWNEPYNKKFWNGDYKDYVKLLKLAHDEIKTLDSSIKVVAPAGRAGYINTILKYIKQELHENPQDYVDVLSFHWYTPRFPDEPAPETHKLTFSQEIEKIRQTMKEYCGNSYALPIWRTEGGIASRSFYQQLLWSEESESGQCLLKGQCLHTPLSGGAVLVKEQVICLSNGVERIFYYLGLPDGKGFFSESAQHSFALEYDGVPQAKMVARAILVNELQDAVFKRTVQHRNEPNFRCYLFSRNNRAFIICWWVRDIHQDIRKVVVTVPLEANRWNRKNLMGNPCPNDANENDNLLLSLNDVEPVYLYDSGERPLDLNVVAQKFFQASISY